jgi:hypothetical protein
LTIIAAEYINQGASITPLVIGYYILDGVILLVTQQLQFLYGCAYNTISKVIVGLLMKLLVTH